MTMSDDALNLSEPQAVGTADAVDTVAADESGDGAETSVEVSFDLAEGAEASEAGYDNPWLRPGSWYVVHTQSGYEKKVKANLEARIQSMNMEEKIFEIVIPMEDVVEFKGGRKQTVQKKVFPGYLLVRCDMDDSSWYCIRNTPGVTGFVGQSKFGQKPTPLSRREVQTFLAAKGDGTGGMPSRKKPKIEFEVGEAVRVKEGPFADFSGEIVEINEALNAKPELVNEDATGDGWFFKIEISKEARIGPGLRLHLNENTAGCSPKVVEAVRADADALVVTGGSPDGTCRMLEEARSRAPKTPLVVGGGGTPETVHRFLELADGVIVGTYLHEHGDELAPVERARAERIVAAARG